jgi:hypothetical protein
MWVLQVITTIKCRKRHTTKVTAVQVLGCITSTNASMRETGRVRVLFNISRIVIMGMGGIVLTMEGGTTIRASRRDKQNVGYP